MPTYDKRTIFALLLRHSALGAINLAQLYDVPCYYYAHMSQQLYASLRKRERVYYMNISKCVRICAHIQLLYTEAPVFMLRIAIIIRWRLLALTLCHLQLLLCVTHTQIHAHLHIYIYNM